MFESWFSYYCLFSTAKSLVRRQLSEASGLHLQSLVKHGRRVVAQLAPELAMLLLLKSAAWARFHRTTTAGTVVAGQCRQGAPIKSFNRKSLQLLLIGCTTRFRCTSWCSSGFGNRFFGSWFCWRLSCQLVSNSGLAILSLRNRFNKRWSVWNLLGLCSLTSISLHAGLLWSLQSGTWPIWVQLSVPHLVLNECHDQLRKLQGQHGETCLGKDAAIRKTNALSVTKDGSHWAIPICSGSHRICLQTAIECERKLKIWYFAFSACAMVSAHAWWCWKSFTKLTPYSAKKVKRLKPHGSDKIAMQGNFTKNSFKLAGSEFKSHVAPVRTLYTRDRLAQKKPSLVLSWKQRMPLLSGHSVHPARHEFGNHFRLAVLLPLELVDQMISPAAESFLGILRKPFGQSLLAIEPGRQRDLGLKRVSIRDFFCLPFAGALGTFVFLGLLLLRLWLWNRCSLFFGGFCFGSTFGLGLWGRLGCGCHGIFLFCLAP